MIIIFIIIIILIINTMIIIISNINIIITIIIIIIMIIIPSLRIPLFHHDTDISDPYSRFVEHDTGQNVVPQSKTPPTSDRLENHIVLEGHRGQIYCGLIESHPNVGAIGYNCIERLVKYQHVPQQP